MPPLFRSTWPRVGQDSQTWACQKYFLTQNHHRIYRNRPKQALNRSKMGIVNFVKLHIMSFSLVCGQSRGYIQFYIKFIMCRSGFCQKKSISDDSSNPKLTKQENGLFSPKIAKNGPIFNFLALGPKTINFQFIPSVFMLFCIFRPFFWKYGQITHFQPFELIFRKLALDKPRMVPEASEIGQMAGFRMYFDQVM